VSIFVTGTSGFLGRAVARHLTEHGRPIRALGRSRNELPASAAFSFLDLKTGEGAAEIPWAECTGLIHLAAAGVKQANRNMADAVAVNVVGTQRILDGLEMVEPSLPIIFAGTYYEDYLGRVPAFRENVYVVTKAAGRDLVRLWAARRPERRIGMATVFQVFGPGDDPRNVLPYVVQGLRTGQRIQLGSGRAEKDWIHVEDAAAGICTLLTVLPQGASEWDIGMGSLYSVRAVVERLAHLAGAEELLEFDPSRDRPDNEIRALATRLPSSWRPRFTLEEGLQRLWEDFR